MLLVLEQYCTPYTLCHFLHPRKFRNCYERKKGPATPSRDDDADDGDDDGDGVGDDNFFNNINEEARHAGVSLPHPPLAAESPSSAPPPQPGLSAPAVSCNIVETSLESLQTEQGVRKLFTDLDLIVSEERTWRVVEDGATNTRDGEKRRTVALEYCRHRIINAGLERVQLS